MAGQGYFEFVAEAVLTAAQVNGFLMDQTVMKAADVGTLDAALGANRAEGMMGYFDDVKRPHFFDGTTWQRVATKIEVDAQENRSVQLLLYMEVLN